MAYLRRLPSSPYWIACFVNASGRETNRSTKLDKTPGNRGAAMSLAQEWEKASRKARQGEMTQAAALKVLSQCVEIATGDSLVVSSISQFFTDYLKSRETSGRADSTVRRYKLVLDAFVKFIGPKRAGASVGSLTAQEIERFRDAEMEAGKGGTTANMSLKILRAALEAAKRKGLALSNPAQAVEMTGALAEERETFTDPELRDMVEAAGDTDWRGMILMGVHCGLRIHDAANLTWEAVDLEAGTLTFRAEKTSRQTRRSIAVWMHPQLAEWLTTRAGDDPRAPLFPALHGKQTTGYGGLSATFGRLMERAGVQPSLGEEKSGKGRRFRTKGFHALRHTMISRLAAANVSSDVRRAMAGHSSDAVHRRYVHLDVSAQRAAVEGLDGI